MTKGSGPESQGKVTAEMRSLTGAMNDPRGMEATYENIIRRILIYKSRCSMQTGSYRTRLHADGGEGTPLAHVQRDPTPWYSVKDTT